MSAHEAKGGLRQRAVEMAAELLATANGDGALADDVRVQGNLNGIVVQILVVRGSSSETVAAGEMPAKNGNGSSSDSRIPLAPHLTKLDRQILEAAATGPQTVGQLAAACDGHDADSYFRGRVRRLRGLGLLAPVNGDRYQLP